MFIEIIHGKDIRTLVNMDFVTSIEIFNDLDRHYVNRLIIHYSNSKLTSFLFDDEPNLKFFYNKLKYAIGEDMIQTVRRE